MNGAELEGMGESQYSVVAWLPQSLYTKTWYIRDNVKKVFLFHIQYKDTQMSQFKQVEHITQK